MPLVRSATNTIVPARLASITHPKLLPVAAILTAVACWGGSFVAMRVAVRVLDPCAVMWIRMLVALAVLLPWMPRRLTKFYHRGDWPLLAAMVIFQPCLYFLLESYALRLTTASQAGVISASVPLLIALGAWIFLRERLSRANVAGMVLAMSGVVALTLGGRADTDASNPLWGNALELAAMACAAANMLLVKKLCRRYDPWTLTALQVLAGTFFFAPGLRSLLRVESAVWSIELIGALFFLGAGVTLGAFGLYNWGMSRMPASRASIYINLVPVIAVMLGWLLLNERLSPFQGLAAVVVVGGVVLSQRR